MVCCLDDSRRMPFVGSGRSAVDGDPLNLAADRGRTMSKAAQSPQEVVLGGMRRPITPFLALRRQTRATCPVQNNNNNKRPPGQNPY
eukprot:3837609-Prymnesium_polylepis.2